MDFPLAEMACGEFPEKAIVSAAIEEPAAAPVMTVPPPEED